MKRPSTTRRTRRASPDLAPDASGVPFAEWLAGVAATAPSTDGVLAAAVAQWRHDWHAPADDSINPLQVARLGMVIARALGHDIEEVFPEVDYVQGCVEAELLADRGASMARRDRALRDSRMRSLHLRHALQLVALARGDPKWEDY